MSSFGVHSGFLRCRQEDREVDTKRRVEREEEEEEGEEEEEEEEEEGRD